MFEHIQISVNLWFLVECIYEIFLFHVCGHIHITRITLKELIFLLLLLLLN